MFNVLKQLLGRAEQNIGNSVNNAAKDVTGHALFGGAPMHQGNSHNLIAPTFSNEKYAPMLNPNGQPQGAQPLQVQPLWKQGLQQPNGDGISPQVQGSQPNLQAQGFNPQIMQRSLGLQAPMTGTDTSYAGGNDAQAGFPASLLTLLGRR